MRSDVERKRLFGVSGEERLPRSAYTAEVSDIVYTICRKRALMALEGGHSVIVDAVHAREKSVTPSPRLPRVPVLPSPVFGSTRPPRPCEAGLPRRVGDVSDATPAVLDEQLQFDLGQQNFAVVDAGRPLR